MRMGRGSLVICGERESVCEGRFKGSSTYHRDIEEFGEAEFPRLLRIAGWGDMSKMGSGRGRFWIRSIGWDLIRLTEVEKEGIWLADWGYYGVLRMTQNGGCSILCKGGGMGCFGKGTWCISDIRCDRQGKRKE